MAWRAAFSNNGEFLAYAGLDCRLKIWDTATGVLKQEYIPSAHLAMAYTCLTWASSRRKGNPGRKNLPDEHQLMLGSMSGTVSIYSVSEADVKLTTSKGHDTGISCLSWSEDSGLLYTGGEDQHLVQWDMSNGSVKRWKSGSDTVHSILAIPGGPWLVSASRNITWWDVESQKVLRTFVGHANPIFHLSCTPGFCLSAASGERVVNAWQLSKDGKEKTAHTSFLLPDDIAFVHVKARAGKKQMWMAVVTKAGTLHIFHHQLKSLSKKALKPTNNIQVVLDTTSTSEATKLIPIQAVSIIMQNNNLNPLIVYGNYLHPMFEKLDSNSLEDNTTLIRKPALTNLPADAYVSKVRAPDIPRDVKHLAPGLLAVPSSSGRKRKDGPTTPSHHLPLEERISLLGKQPADAPGKEGLAQLLMQGLRSQDAQLMQVVLGREEEGVIDYTVRRLPVQVVVPLLKEIKRTVETGRNGRVTHLKWLRAVLYTHTSYLSSCPDAENLLCSLWALLDARTNLFGPLCQLKGKLELLSQHATSEEPQSGQQQEALLVYEEGSDDENNIMDELNHSAESEDIWEDSDMDVDGDGEGKAAGSEDEDS